MVVDKEENYENSKIKKIFIKSFTNIWADHKRNDLEYIEIIQKNSDGALLMPETLKIKFKGFLYKLRKI